LRGLRAGDATREAAIARLHAVLLRAARFEVARRRSTVTQTAGDTEEVARAAAAEALNAVLARLDDYGGDSRFTTWAAKFAVLEAAVQVRRRAWRGRALPTAGAAEHLADDGLEPAQRELLATLRAGIDALRPHQREVLVALALNSVPIDVLAERLGATRGALYRTLHDARAELRRQLPAAGPAPG
jgi:RNA polymerase sigma-70 factor (ECF subfamily)